MAVLLLNNTISRLYSCLIPANERNFNDAFENEGNISRTLACYCGRARNGKVVGCLRTITGASETTYTFISIYETELMTYNLERPDSSLI